ncbi:MAG: hypothetical protein P9F19_11090 [Candidatus Contendobacter sp.]|nr:hypothetical protein [Candidatus Contendobacter sp.]MDG4557913.1 hypothetical protein [Candidatus Contendobacter sp.]
MPPLTAAELLIHLRDTLADLDGVASCKIGLEANITPDQYPLIRLVPARLRPAVGLGYRQTLDLTIYFGDALLEAADGLEAVYERLLGMEEAIRAAVLTVAPATATTAGQRLRVRAVETLFDEDRLPHYKLMASRFEVEG